jgi:hypothetical protein
MLPGHPINKAALGIFEPLKAFSFRRGKLFYWRFVLLLYSNADKSPVDKKYSSTAHYCDAVLPDFSYTDRRTELRDAESPLNFLAGISGEAIEVGLLRELKQQVGALERESLLERQPLPLALEQLSQHTFLNDADDNDQDQASYSSQCLAKALRLQ